jgi:hypothetical protein
MWIVRDCDTLLEMSKFYQLRLETLEINARKLWNQNSIKKGKLYATDWLINVIKQDEREECHTLEQRGATKRLMMGRKVGEKKNDWYDRMTLDVSQMLQQQ